MAMQTPCQTSGAIFHTEVSERRVSVSVDLPMALELDEAAAELLEANLHNAMELVLARYFAQ